MKKVQLAQTGYIMISVAFYAAAVLSLFSDRLPPLILSILCGVCLLAYGIIKIIGYFSEDLYCLAFRYDLAFGLFLLVIGTVVLALYTRAAAWLAPGIGWLALLDGVLKVQMSQEAKKFGLEQWGLIAATAAATGILAVFVIVYCATAPEAPRVLTALTLLSVGVMNHCVAVFTVKRPSHLK